MSLFFLYKLARGDLRYWLNVQGALSWIATFVARISVKIIVDFTLIVHCRHSCELGGAYWSFNVFSNQVFCFISVYLYEKHSIEKSDEVGGVLWKLVTGLLIFSMLNFGLFLKSIKQDYIKTFFSAQNSSEYLCTNFKNATSDEEKIVCFCNHPSLYETINQDLMEWLNDNWSKWEENPPDWFTPNVIASIPAHMLPVSVLASMGGEAGRRKSIESMKKEEEEKLKVGRKQSVRGSDLKIIPDFVAKDEEEEGGGREGGGREG